ncbi:hypothetical protein COU20_02490 [Candidatus Kaiserbacteria bacterium CG10_big_fil_rev_8_21_14_0_10_59_10]|uniref:GIY-YIG domain-containing protein n=1 Tax=Candidatus Kaiserbacteria bacterium CG10_big_fil_rev_8_21_14_0_10_59_10 TaxID=1974612 RepID=A0A2H0U7G8_9BACT|nr:MAG: hypothetical protein COU20_02490 [Candidatus Kaiserbacteria bacterium CG10_big_fil_rev_8_21_14_0_10_59_10]
MHYVYIIKSERDGELYVGSTNNLRRRLAEHNAGVVESTARRRPFALRYYEAYHCEKDARVREMRLKKDGRALYVLKKRIATSLQ